MPSRSSAAAMAMLPSVAGEQLPDNLVLKTDMAQFRWLRSAAIAHARLGHFKYFLRQNFCDRIGTVGLPQHPHESSYAYAAKIAH